MSGELVVGERRVGISHPDRLLWPATGTTKDDLIRYLLDVAPAMLPHLRGRGLTLGRWPEGVDGAGWMQVQCRGRPPWLSVQEIVGRTGTTYEYCVVDDAAGLAWLGNLGTIELHPFISTVDRPAEPSFLVLDLDPGPPASIVECARVAIELRARLDDLGLAAWPKTSGGLGLHVFAPLEPGHDFEAAKAIARALAEELAARLPALVTAASGRAGRSGRVFVDWVQNDRSRSTVAAYSPRAMPIPLVSTPLTWDEVARLARLRRPGLFGFGFDDVRERLDRFGDLFAETLTRPQRLPARPAGSAASRPGGGPP